MVRSVFFVLAVLFVSFDLNNCQCTIELDTDYLGTPISNDLSTVAATSYADCCAKCSAQTEANCAAWTFVFNTCFFKSNTGLRINSPGSELKFERTLSKDYSLNLIFVTKKRRV